MKRLIPLNRQRTTEECDYVINQMMAWTPIIGLLVWIITRKT